MSRTKDLNITEPRNMCNIVNVNSCVTKAHRNGLSSSHHRTTFFKFCWWNGGGRIKYRLMHNPRLRKLLEKKPDLFVYSESETPPPLVWVLMRMIASYTNQNWVLIIITDVAWQFFTYQNIAFYSKKSMPPEIMTSFGCA